MLSIDGSSNQQGSGTDVILEGPNGLLIEQTLRFAFKASNNKAEYEALIAGMLLAKEMGAQNLLAKSELVHVPRDQNARDDLLAKLANSGKGGR